MQKLGKWAFIIGLVLAVAATRINLGTWGYAAIAILGLVIGFLNITDKERNSFLLAAIGLVMSASAVRGVPLVGEWLTNVMGNIVLFVSPAVLVVALIALLDVAKD